MSIDFSVGLPKDTWEELRLPTSSKCWQAASCIPWHRLLAVGDNRKDPLIGLYDFKAAFIRQINQWPTRVAEFLGLVTDDVENGILASQVSSLHEFRVINYSVFFSYR